LYGYSLQGITSTARIYLTKWINIFLESDDCLTIQRMNRIIFFYELCSLNFIFHIIFSTLWLCVYIYILKQVEFLLYIYYYLNFLFKVWSWLSDPLSWVWHGRETQGNGSWNHARRKRFWSGMTTRPKVVGFAMTVRSRWHELKKYKPRRFNLTWLL